MMKNYDQLVEIKHNPNLPYIPDHPQIILIIGCSGSGKTNVLLNLIKINYQIWTKFTYRSKIHSNRCQFKCQLHINGREEGRIKKLKNPKAFIDYSQTIDDVYENLEDHNPAKKRRVLILIDNMIADMESNKKLSPIVTELFLKGRKLNS